MQRSTLVLSTIVSYTCLSAVLSRGELKCFRKSGVNAEIVFGMIKKILNIGNISMSEAYFFFYSVESFFYVGPICCFPR